MSSPITLTAFEDRLFADLPDAELAEVLRSRGLPGRRTETWKWSDLRGALREPRDASGTYAHATPEPLITLEGATLLVLKNGRPEAPRGVEPKPIVKHGEKIGVTYVVEDGLIVSFYDEGRDAGGAIDPGAELGELAASAPLISISVLPEFEHKVVVRRLSDGAGHHDDNLFVTVSEGAKLTLVETHEIADTPFINSRTEIEVDAKASCERFVLQPSAPEAVLVHTSVIRLDEQKDDVKATFDQTTLALGASLARHETRLSHLGSSEANLGAIYRLADKMHTDLTSHITFHGEGGSTDQLVKGIGGGQSRGVFQGKFLVEKGAQYTDAKMAHHALLLAKGAHINAKPELEIYADDVECAHGNTVGALDGEAIFYMRQRGVSEEDARALLIDAFAGEVLERVQDEDLRTQLEAIFRGEA